MNLDSEKYGLAILATFFGLFFLCAGLFKIRWIYRHNKTRILFYLFGERGVQFVYMALGVGLILYAFIKVIDSKMGLF